MNEGPDFKNSLEKWKNDLSKTLRGLDENHLLRSLKKIPGVDFLSNDYLSLNSSGLLTDRLKKITSDWNGTAGSTGSRLLQGHNEHFEKAENDFSKFTGFKSSLLYQSGYSANTGVIPALVSKDDLILSDKNCHASIIDGIRLSGSKNLRFRHNDFNHLESILKKEAVKTQGRVWIFSETLFSMDGDMPDLNLLADLSEKYGALLYLDEAHAVGVFGKNGSGLAAETNLQDRIAVCVYPMGKAPGLSGAFVCGSNALKDFLINQSRSFIFSTAQPPILAALLSEIIIFLKTEKAEELRQDLFNNSELLRKSLKEGDVNTGLTNSQIIPVICGNERKSLDLSESLIENGFAARAIRPPSVPKGTSRLRLAVHSDHTESQIQNLSRMVQNFFQEN
ncbi:MAG: 8-amino-7-oxononanoate synthase [Spirochaetia bacterium]|nr:8-amino-7-oxononanoate synthase [Spirochaetia bacterium]